MTKRRGTTLIEIMVASSLLLLLLLVAVQILIPALRAWTDGQKRSEVSQGLLVTSNWLAEDVIRAAPDSMQVSGDGVLLMRCALGQETDHTNEFKEVVAFWVEDETLYRATHVLAVPSAGLPSFSLGEVKQWSTRRTLVTGVKNFEANVINPWRLEFSLSLEKQGRLGETKSSFSSIYAPLDASIAESETP